MCEHKLTNTVPVSPKPDLQLLAGWRRTELHWVCKGRGDIFEPEARRLSGYALHNASLESESGIMLSCLRYALNMHREVFLEPHGTTRRQPSPFCCMAQGKTNRWCRCTPSPHYTILPVLRNYCLAAWFLLLSLPDRLSHECTSLD